MFVLTHMRYSTPSCPSLVGEYWNTTILPEQQQPEIAGLVEGGCSWLSYGASPLKKVSRCIGHIRLEASRSMARKHRESTLTGQVANGPETLCTQTYRDQ